MGPPAMTIHRPPPILWRLILYLRPFWGRWALGISAMTGVTIVGLVPPLLIRALVDRILPHPERHRELITLVAPQAD